jgi:tripartite-type tricarboxylate transporter receptor subunit TctC
MTVLLSRQAVSRTLYAIQDPCIMLTSFEGGLAMENRFQTSRLQRRLACVVTVLASACGGATAQDLAYPTRAVQIVVPYSTGTTADIVARLLGPKLAERWKVNVITDNRPGATGGIGMGFVAKATPDGHTLMIVVASYSMIPAVYPKLPFDPVKSFAPVALLTTSGLALVVHPQLPVKTVRELVQLAKRRPGELHYASPGNGSAQHLAMELFKLETGTDIVHVPHKGLAAALTDVVGGHVQTIISTFQTVHPHVTSGRLRMLAATSAERSQAFPHVPTMKEQGLPQLEFETWSGALAPAATPATVIAKLNSDINTLLQQPAIREQLSRQGMNPAGGAPEHFGALLQSELARWSRVVTAAKIKPD